LIAILWPDFYAQSHSDNDHVHVHATDPCSADALAQARPTMSYIIIPRLVDYYSVTWWAWL